MTRMWKHWPARALAGMIALMVSGAFSPAAPDQHDATRAGDADAFPRLRDGETMTGIYVMGGPVAATTRTVGYIDAQLTFLRRISDHAKYKAELIPQGQSVTAHCPGLRHAAPGYLCVYEVYKDERETLGGVYNPIGTGGAIDRDGAVLYGSVESASSDDGDAPFSTGGWAITGRDRHSVTHTSPDESDIAGAVPAPLRHLVVERLDGGERLPSFRMSTQTAHQVRAVP
jgi:hypothetical protein